MTPGSVGSASSGRNRRQRFGREDKERPHKTPLDTDDTLPELMRSLLGYEFFTFDDETPLERIPGQIFPHTPDRVPKVFRCQI